jgi:hypothetical protein
MQRRRGSFRLPVLAQDALLAVFITVMQIQGTVTRDPTGVTPARRSPTSETWGTSC